MQRRLNKFEHEEYDLLVIGGWGPRKNQEEVDAVKNHCLHPAMESVENQTISNR